MVEKNHIIVFSVDGEFQRYIGRQGSGPGEFQQPLAMTLLGNGKLAVSDPMSGKFTLFDSSYAFDGEIIGFFPVPPLEIEEEIEDFNNFLDRKASGGGGRMRSMGIQISPEDIDYEPDPYHFAISDLIVDGQERLWVRRGPENRCPLNCGILKNPLSRCFGCSWGLCC